MALDTVSNFLINGNNPATVGGSGTTIKLFANLSGNFTSGVTPSQTKNAYLFCPDSNKANNQRLIARASGNFTIGNPSQGNITSPVVTVALYPVLFAGNVPNGAVTIGGQTVAPYTGATAIISQVYAAASDLSVVGYPWALEVALSGDNTSGLLQALDGTIAIDGIAGSFSANVPLTGVNMNSALPFGLVVGITFSISDPAASANMYQFALLQ